VLDESFDATFTGCRLQQATVTDSSDTNTASSHVDPTIILLALPMEDYLKLWPKRAKLVQRACWLHKSVQYLNQFDRTEIVRITCDAQVQEETVKVDTVLCRRGCVADKLYIVMSGKCMVERWVQVDKVINEIMRTRGGWLGPSDDWEHQKTVEGADDKKEESVDAASDTEETPVTKNDTAQLGIGMVDKSRAARALRRVVGFAGLEGLEHVGKKVRKGKGDDLRAHKSRTNARTHTAKDADSGSEDNRTQVKVGARHLECGSAFGFWKLAFGDGEPGDVVARMESKVHCTLKSLSL
jgi:hypothetical protein